MGDITEGRVGLDGGVGSESFEADSILPSTIGVKITMAGAKQSEREGG